MEINLDHIAKLAKLRLTEEEKQKLSAELPSIIEYIARLREVDTTDIDARAYLTDAVNVFREDEPVVDQSIRDAVIADFPKKGGDALEVPGVFAAADIDPRNPETGRV